MIFADVKGSMELTEQMNASRASGDKFTGDGVVPPSLREQEKRLRRPLCTLCNKRTGVFPLTMAVPLAYPFD